VRMLPGPLLRSLLTRRRIWRRIALERLTEPLHLNLLSLFVAVFGTYRAKIAFDLIVRQEYAFGMLEAAELARARGLARVTVVELGVGAGTGLMNLAAIGRRLERATGVELDVVGFDSGRGLPAPGDYRDHPEAYREGWYPMDVDKLRRALGGSARLVIGPLEQTIAPFVSTLGAEAPLGFVSLDVDYYASARAGLEVLAGRPDAYLPHLPVYVDDIDRPSHNARAGELLAIDEFNRDHPTRMLEPARFLAHRRVFKHAEWLEHVFALHVLDHPERSVPKSPDPVRDPGNPYLGVSGHVTRHDSGRDG
jgi:hypothetical protein